MKTAKFLIPLMLLAVIVKAQKPADKTKATTPAAAPAVTITGTPTDEIYEYLVLKHTDTPAPEGYGLKPGILIPVGAYVDAIGNERKINAQINKFLKSLLWADGSPVIWVSRSTSMIDNVNVDQFRVTKEGTKDTISLYVDEYKSEPIMAPKGFRFFNKQEFFSEFIPILTEMAQYNSVADKYGDAANKQLSFKILGDLQQTVGMDQLLDKNMTDPIVNDPGIDLDLKAYLVRSYMFHKFEYELTGAPDPQSKAFNAVVDDYESAIKQHEIFAKGSLATYLVKKS